MRVTSFVEGLLFTMGLLVLCLVILIGRSPSPQRLAPLPVSTRKRIS